MAFVVAYDACVLYPASIRDLLHRLLRENPAFDRALRELNAAARNGRPVRVRLTEAHGDLIEDVDREP